jgi:tRNA(Ile)-lysidine synthase
VYIEDPSNSDTRFGRNALRAEVMPPLRKHFPGVVDQLAQFANHARSAQELLDEFGAQDLASAHATDHGFELAPIHALSRARASNALRCWFRSRGLYVPSTRGLESTLDQILGSASPKRRIICGERTFRVYRGAVVIDPVVVERLAPSEVIKVRWHGESLIEVPQWHGFLQFTCGTAEGMSESRLRGAELTLRARAGGERLKIADQRPSRSLKNLYQESSIPAWKRRTLPLLYCDDRLVMAAGLGMDVRATAGVPDFVSRVWVEWIDSPETLGPPPEELYLRFDESSSGA